MGSRKLDHVYPGNSKLWRVFLRIPAPLHCVAAFPSLSGNPGPRGMLGVPQAEPLCPGWGEGAWADVYRNHLSAGSQNPTECQAGSVLSGTFPPAFVSVSSSNFINMLGAGVGTSPRLYVNVNSPNWCWSLIIPGFPPPLPACIEETCGAKAKRVFIHKSWEGGAGAGWHFMPGGAFFTSPSSPSPI